MKSIEDEYQNEEDMRIEIDDPSKEIIKNLNSRKIARSNCISNEMVKKREDEWDEMIVKILK